MHVYIHLDTKTLTKDLDSIDPRVLANLPPEIRRSVASMRFVADMMSASNSPVVELHDSSLAIGEKARTYFSRVDIYTAQDERNAKTDELEDAEEDT